MKTVMLVGGGIQEVRAVEFAQRLGYRVVVTDRSPDAPCVEPADESHVVDGQDVEGLVGLALDLVGEDRLHGVFTLTELVAGVAAVAQAAGLPGADIGSAVLCQDKGLAKREWLRHGISTPAGGVARSLEEAVELLAGLDGPCIIKPVEGFGAIGVQGVESAADLRSYFADWGSAPPGAWVVEQRLAGASHDVNGLFDASGTFHPQGIADREFVEGTFAEHQVRAPTALANVQQSELYGLLEEAAEAFEISSGPVKGDAILSEGRFVMLEIAPRLHGPKMSLFALPESGQDYWPDFLSVITGGPVIGMSDLPSKYFLSNSIPAAAGRITAINGADAVRGWEGIVDVMLFRRPGDAVSATANSTDVVGYVLTATESEAAGHALIERALEAISIEVA